MMKAALLLGVHAAQQCVEPDTKVRVWSNLDEPGHDYKEQSFHVLLDPEELAKCLTSTATSLFLNPRCARGWQAPKEPVSLYSQKAGIWCKERWNEALDDFEVRAYQPKAYSNKRLCEKSEQTGTPPRKKCDATIVGDTFKWSIFSYKTKGMTWPVTCVE